MSDKSLAEPVAQRLLVNAAHPLEIGHVRTRGKAPRRTATFRVTYLRLLVFDLCREEESRGSSPAFRASDLELLLREQKPEEVLERCSVAGTFLGEWLRRGNVRSAPGVPAVVPDAEDCWRQLRNESLEIAGRVDALDECSLADPPKLLKYVLYSLGDQGIDSQWRDALVAAVEPMRIDDDTEREKLANSLLKIARDLNISGTPEHQGAAWSALRKFSLLVPRDRANELVEFIKPADGVDARLIALICIGRIFEVDPGVNSKGFELLADRVHSFAQKFLDTDVLIDGWNAAVAQASVKGLVFLGDTRAADTIKHLRSTAPLWFVDQMHDKLKEALDVWCDVDAEHASHPTYQSICSAIAMLSGGQ